MLKTNVFRWYFSECCNSIGNPIILYCRGAMFLVRDRAMQVTKRPHSGAFGIT